MIEKRFGSINRRELCIRLYAPWRLQSWDGYVSRLSLWKMLNPLNWLRAALDKYNWDFWCRRFNEGSHRCYCPEGIMFDGRIVVAGFGVTWFYSRYDGEIPCVCDKVMQEEFGEELEVEA